MQETFVVLVDIFDDFIAENHTFFLINNKDNETIL